MNGFLMADAMNTVARQFPDKLRHHRLPVGWPEEQAGQRARPHLRDQREQLPDRLHGREDGREAGRQAGHQRRRRPGDPDRHDLPRRLRGGRQGRQPGHHGPEGLLPGVRPAGASARSSRSTRSPRARRSSSRWPAAAASAPSRRPQDKGVWGIGVDRDQSDLGPHILTSAREAGEHLGLRHDQAVQDGTFKGGGDSTFDLRTTAWPSARSARRSRRRSSTRWTP